MLNSVLCSLGMAWVAGCSIAAAAAACKASLEEVEVEVEDSNELAPDCKLDSRLSILATASPRARKKDTGSIERGIEEFPFKEEEDADERLRFSPENVTSDIRVALYLHLWRLGYIQQAQRLSLFGR